MGGSRVALEDQIQTQDILCCKHPSDVLEELQRVADKTNEIPCKEPLLENLDIEGAVVTADALHTQTETARFIVEEKKADYVFTVKDNQPTLCADVELLLLEAFSPSGDDGQQGARSGGDAPTVGER